MNWRALILVAATAFVATAAADTPDAPPLRAQIWTQDSAALAHNLTHGPGECLRRQTTIEARQSVEIGRTLFRSPALLGGPAARTGLSCNACHSNGRTNANFFLPELTNRIGAADVTSEWASKVRGDGVMNPLNIPDLAGVGTRPDLGRLHEPSLETFVHSVITEEFQGPEPTPQAFTGLIAYLRALDPAVCPSVEVPDTLQEAADDVRRGLAAAQSADPATARLVLLATQDAVGRVVERLPARNFESERAALEELSRELGDLRLPDGQIGPALTDTAPAWRARFDGVIAQIRENRTYFSEGRLSRELIPPDVGPRH